MTITKTAVAKVAVVATSLAMATSMLAFAQFAHAQTACSVGTTDLTIGSSGAAVTCLQQVLIGAGYAIPAGATGYFGMQTKAAVGQWQAAVGITPAAGYFGPISRAKFSGSVVGGTPTSTVPGCVAGAMFSSTTGAACTSTTTTVPGCVAGAMFSSTTGQACSGTGSPSTPTGPLAGTDGSITDVTKLGSYNNEDVAEGNSGVKVLGADIEVSSDGDIALKSVKVQFDPYGNSGSDNLDNYLDTVDVWLGSTKIGSADVDEFSQDSNDVWTKTITLNNATIREGETEKFYISVDATGNIDSADISGDSWTVGIQNFRFVDGSGVTTTDDSTGDLGAAAVTVTAAGTGGVTINFDTFSASADTDLKVSTASGNPEAGVVIIDDVSNTDNVTLLKGKLKLDGTSDVLLDEFPVTLTTVGGASLAAVTGSVTLKIGGEEYTESVSSSDLVATVIFDNLDFAIDAGDTVDFEVLADINDIDAGNLDEGDTLKASVTSTNRDYMDVENAQGDQLSDSTEKSGTATGNAQELRSGGITLAMVSQSAVSNNNDAADTGTFKIKFKITANDTTVYVSSLVSAVTYAVDRAGTATTANTITGFTTVTDGTGGASAADDLTSVGNYTIQDGDFLTLELTVTVPNGTGGTTAQYKTAITGVLWDTLDDTSPANTYSSNLGNFKTDTVLLDNA